MYLDEGNILWNFINLLLSLYNSGGLPVIPVCILGTHISTKHDGDLSVIAHNIKKQALAKTRNINTHAVGTKSRTVFDIGD